MGQLVALDGRPLTIPSMSELDIGKVRELEEITRSLPQVPVQTLHVIHAGMYSRTIMIPAGVVLTGVLVKRTTQLTVSGVVTVYVGDDSMELRGYHVFPASANRKQAFLAHTDTFLTMSFATDATTVEEAEAEFTDEVDQLMSRKDPDSNLSIITGE